MAVYIADQNGNFDYQSPESIIKIAIKRLLKSAHLPLTKAVNAINETYPESASTVQNINNKLTSGSIRFSEVEKLAEISGYNIVFIPFKDAAPEDDSAVAPKVAEKRASANNSIRDANRPIKAKANTDTSAEDEEALFIEAVNKGCAVVNRINHGQIIFAGKQAEEAAQAYQDHCTIPQDEHPIKISMREISLAAYAAKVYNVEFKIVE